MSRSNIVGIPTTKIQQDKQTTEYIKVTIKVYKTYMTLLSSGYIVRISVGEDVTTMELRDVFVSKTIAELIGNNLEDMLEKLILEEGSKYV